MVGPLEPHFEGQGAKMSNGLHNRNWSIWLALLKTVNLFEIDWTIIEKWQSKTNMTQNEHVSEICCQPEVDADVISGQNVKTVEGYVVVNFEVASCRSFLNFF